MGTLGQSSDLVSAMASAIAQMEGYNPAYAGNNNPGNLVFIGQSGATKGAGGFAAFPTLAAGQAALANQIQYQINQGQTLTQFFNQYAPGGTVNADGGVQTSAATQNYINVVSNQLGIDPNVPLNQVAMGSYSGGSSSTDTASIADSSQGDNTDDGSTDYSSTVALVGVAALGVGLLYVLFG